MVSERELVDGKLIKPGDKIIGIESSGLHSNGYSLINDMLWRHKIYYKETPELLTPTTIYAPIVKKLMETETILGMSHITGGGIPENLPRCLPEGLTAKVDYTSWKMPEIFTKIMCAGEILEDEMKKVFNLGIGFCVVVAPEDVDKVQMLITPYHECWLIGEVVVQ
jgi:phosphoribosylformylglycinamidine cyclo-ligase